MTEPSSQNTDMGSLERVQTAVRDAINGYETMHEKAEPSFRHVVDHILAVHRRHDADLVRVLAADPSTDATSGSWMSTVHQSVVTVRSWFDEIDHGLIPQIIDGEERLVDAYDDALASGPPTWAANVLEAQRQEVITLINELRARAS